MPIRPAIVLDMRGVSYKYFESDDGARICYDSQILNHDGYVFIFLHGLGGDLTAWDVERKQLKKLGYSSVAVDLRGHGLSSRSEDENFYDLENFCKDVIQLINYEKIKKPIIVGHCFGGMIALLIEFYFPSTANAIILIDTSSKPPYFVEPFIHHKLAYKILHLISEHAPKANIHGHIDFKQFIDSPDIDAKRILSDVLHTSIKTYLFIVEKLVDYDAERVLRQLRVPTLIIEGRNDSIIPPARAEHLKDKIKNSKISYILNANHILITNNPQAVVNEIIGFASQFFD